MSSHYDYIISGAGCAGLSLALHMIHSGRFTEKKILLIDRDQKKTNDRTWCFWEKEKGIFEPVVSGRWQKAWFRSDGFSKLLDLSPYQYKMIRGIDFYGHCRQVISQQMNFEFAYGDVKEISSSKGAAEIVVNNSRFASSYIFNSILFKKPEIKRGEYFLQQHFQGWLIQADRAVFSKEEATLMDFRVAQDYGTTFVYILPLSDSSALVEYTIFSENILSQDQYNHALREYIAEYLRLANYEILEMEFGTIPMTNSQFPTGYERVIQIGTAGGQTKASTGYTFQYIQKNSASIVKSILTNGDPTTGVQNNKKRFDWYDSILLNILSNKKLEGRKIFSELFRKNKPSKILKFLDNETSLAEEFKLLNTLPKLPFIKAGIEQLGK
jgi:lycopene beta-cyclase